MWKWLSAASVGKLAVVGLTLVALAVVLATDGALGNLAAIMGVDNRP